MNPCHLCAFWARHDFPPETISGDCRKHAPLLIHHEQSSVLPGWPPQIHREAAWPKTYALEGCGDWKLKGDAPGHCETCSHWKNPYLAGNGKTYGYCNGLTDMFMGCDPADDILTEPKFGCLRYCKQPEPAIDKHPAPAT